MRWLGCIQHQNTEKEKNQTLRTRNDIPDTGRRWSRDDERKIHRVEARRVKFQREICSLLYWPALTVVKRRQREPILTGARWSKGAASEKNERKTNGNEPNNSNRISPRGACCPIFAARSMYKRRHNIPSRQRDKDARQRERERGR